ncbi:MAG TPA: hypothetical protein VFE07_14790 [Marmoricola sp.]|jgi:hypothetical protein|nr:hypothetical protein [Marmoricola sp.]
MAFWMVFLVLFIAVGAGALYVVRDQSLVRERVETELHDPRTPTLEYSVATGQDPAPILAALERAGFTAGVDPHGAHQVVLVKCPAGRERARTTVRSLIGDSLHTDVHFRDEE